MSGNKVGVKMSEKHVSDLQGVLRGKRQVLADVALRIDDNSRARLFVANNIRSVRETWQIELLKDHGSDSLIDAGRGRINDAHYIGGSASIGGPAAGKRRNRKLGESPRHPPVHERFD
jgi:hypothetical protein